MRFSYEWDNNTNIFKFFDNDYLIYLEKIFSEKNARNKADLLIKEIEDFENDSKFSKRTE